MHSPLSPCLWTYSCTQKSIYPILRLAYVNMVSKVQLKHDFSGKPLNFWVWFRWSSWVPLVFMCPLITVAWLCLFTYQYPLLEFELIQCRNVVFHLCIPGRQSNIWSIAIADHTNIKHELNTYEGPGTIRKSCFIMLFIFTITLCYCGFSIIPL